MYYLSFWIVWGPIGVHLQMLVYLVVQFCLHGIPFFFSFLCGIFVSGMRLDHAGIYLVNIKPPLCKPAPTVPHYHREPCYREYYPLRRPTLPQRWKSRHIYCQGIYCARVPRSRLFSLFTLHSLVSRSHRPGTEAWPPLPVQT